MNKNPVSLDGMAIVEKEDLQLARNIVQQYAFTQEQRGFPAHLYKDLYYRMDATYRQDNSNLVAVPAHQGGEKISGVKYGSTTYSIGLLTTESQDND